MANIKNFQKPLLIGALFGFIAPFIGLFVGSQVMPLLGDLLMFPFVIIGKIVDQPFGEMSTNLLLFCLLISMVVWGLIFMLVSKLIRSLKN
jgi:ABC-type dipeptide/oligopeptide/nickel transport system permease subunit